MPNTSFFDGSVVPFWFCQLLPLEENGTLPMESFLGQNSSKSYVGSANIGRIRKGAL